MPRDIDNQGFPARRRASPLGRAVGAALAVLALAGPVAGQTPPQRAQIPPDTRSGGRLDQIFREAPVPPPTTPAPSLEVEQLPPETAPDSAANIPLQIQSMTILGVTAYPPGALDEYWKDRVGKPGTLGDLFTIASQITNRYRNDGFVLSRAVVPAQEIDEGGRVTLQVVEGFVDQVVFEGDEDRPGLHRAFGEAITGKRPIRVSDLERYLLLIADQPGITVTSILRPSEKKTGAADLIVKLEREDWNNFATLDNRGTRYVGPVQATVGTRLNSFFGLGEQTFIRAISTPIFPNELMAFDVNTSFLLDEEGTTVATIANFARAHPGWILRTPTDLDINSTAVTMGLLFGRPIIRSRVQNLRATLAFVANDYKTTSGLAGAVTEDGAEGDSLLLRDKIRSVRVGLVYETVDTWRGANAAGVQFSHGLDILGATKSGTDKLSRAAGRSDYSKITFEASRLQSLGGPWALLTGFTSQIAFTPLLASEQFGLGGSNYLRAYDPSDIVGDQGVGAKFELQYSQSPKLSYLNDYQLYTYFDVGGVWNKVTQEGDKTPDSAISIGFGSRFSIGEWASGYMEVAQPLMRNVPTQNEHFRPRIFFAMIAKF